MNPIDSFRFLDIYQVGIIMYLPTADEKQREAITERFFEYRKSAQHQIWDTYGAHEHWAKIEVSKSICCLIFYIDQI